MSLLSVGTGCECLGDPPPSLAQSTALLRLGGTPSGLLRPWGAGQEMAAYKIVPKCFSGPPVPQLVRLGAGLLNGSYREGTQKPQ